VTLNAAHVVVAFGQEYRLNFVLEVLKIQLIGRCSSELDRTREKHENK
jgi:hypothetical protein